MGRSESQQAFNQSSAQSSQDQNNAQTALGSENAAITNYGNNLNNFLRFGRSTYGANGEYMRDENTLANTTAAAGTTKMAGDLALNAARTGENTANYAPTVAESQRQSERDLTNQLATADANRLQQLTAINQYGVQASALPAELYGSMYGTSLGGSNSAMGNATSAAKTPGFWDTFLPALAGGGATVGAAAIKSCWIAAAFYGGWYDPRTILLRAWLNQEFIKTWKGRMTMLAYRRFGERIAASLPQYPTVAKLLRCLFDRGLQKARAWRERTASQSRETGRPQSQH